MERIATAYVIVAGESEAAAAELVEHLVTIAGPALAPESSTARRVERRRGRRERKTDKKHERDMSAALDMAKDFTAAAIEEHDRTGKWPEWIRRRKT